MLPYIGRKPQLTCSLSDLCHFFPRVLRRGLRGLRRNALCGSVVHRYSDVLASAPARGVLTSHPQRTMSAFQTRLPVLTVVQPPEQEQE
jgi:hypothetical protein